MTQSNTGTEEKGIIRSVLSKDNSGCCVDQMGAGMLQHGEQLLACPGSRALRNLPKTTYSGIRLVDQNRPWCEYLHQVNLPTLQTGAPLPSRLVANSPAHHCLESSTVGQARGAVAWCRAVRVEVKGCGWIWKDVCRWN